MGMTTLTLPLLFLADTVVLPGMVVPVELDGDRQAAVDAARLAARDTTPAGSSRPDISSDSYRSGRRDTHEETPRVLVVPRIDGKYGAVGATSDRPRHTTRTVPARQQYASTAAWACC
jgi:ATP-dependent Lon protease